jgi:stage V sporulation protein B
MIGLRERTVTAITWDTFGRTILFFLSFAGSLIGVRMLGTALYGQLAIILSLYFFVILGTSFGFRNTILRFIPQLLLEKDQSGIRGLLKTVCCIRLSAWAVVSVALVFGSGTLSGAVLGHPELKTYIKILPIFLLVPLVLDIAQAVTVSTFHQRLRNLTEIGTKSLYLILLTILLWIQWGIFGALTAALISQLVALFILWHALSRKLDLRQENEDTSTLTSRRLIEFSISSYLLSSLAFVLGKELDVLLLGRFSDHIGQVTVYTVAFTFVTLSSRFVLTGLAGGFSVPLVAELYSKSDRNGLRRAYSGFFEYIYLFTIPLSVGGMILGEQIVIWLYGQEFKGIGQLLVPLFMLTCLAKIDGIAATFLMGMDRERDLLVLRGSCGVINIILNLILIPRYGALGAVWGTGISMVLTGASSSVLLHNLIKPEYPIKFLIQITVSTSVMAASILISKHFVFSTDSFLDGGILLILGVCVYGTMITLFKPISPGNLDALAQIPFPFFRQLASLLRR